jgi:hypothetical protein
MEEQKSSLRKILESKFPKGNRLFSKKNTHLTKSKKKK